jgi:hypothetical protein
MTDQDMTDEVMNAGYAADVDAIEGDDDTARLEADIAATREEMTGTVEAIGDRLAPSNIVKEATSTVREATVGKVGDMTSTASDALSGAGTTVQETGSGILETIKQNPIPAAMAGIGIAWLWTHRADGGMNKFGSMDDWRARGRTGYSGYGTNTQSWDSGYGGSDRWSDSQMSGDQMQSGGIGDKVGDVTDELGRRAADVGDMAGRVPSQLGGGAQGLARQAQDVMEQSPLAAGAVALAVGAAISMALPATQAERRVLGPTAGQVLGQVESTATDALQKARDTTTA